MLRIRILAGVVIAVAAYGALSAYLVSVSLQPSRGRCASAGLPPDVVAEPVAFSSRADGARLAGWLSRGQGQRAVVLVHGIDSDAWSGAAPDLVRAYRGAGFDVLLFDLRAHGGSEGSRIGLGALERGDVRAAVDVLLERGIAPGRIGLHGTSYGAAMALIAAAEIPEVGAIVADSAFADVRDLIATEVASRTHVPALIAGWIMRPGIVVAARALYGLDLVRLAPETAISRIAPRPILLVHGADDAVIPTEHARRLERGAASPEVELWLLEGKGHTEGVRSGPCNTVPAPDAQRFLDRTIGFMDRALGTSADRGQ